MSSSVLRRNFAVFLHLSYRCVVVLALVVATLPTVAQPVDYARDIQPIFTNSCEGGFCHIGLATSGVELTDFQATWASRGGNYNGPIVLPFNSRGSPLWDKLANEFPLFGSRMPFLQAQLTQEQIDLIARWIDEGAREFPGELLRGDFDYGDTVDFSDAVLILRYLFEGGAPPYCFPVADANEDQRINVADALYLLNYLFVGGPRLSKLSVLDRGQCSSPNEPPEVEPIGTIEGREGLTLEFQVFAIDPEGGDLTFTLERAPVGVMLDRNTGRVSWTPRFGQTGDYRIRIQVTDAAIPALSAVTTGLIRVLEGNHPPLVDSIGTVYGREQVALVFSVVASDFDDDSLMYELLEGPAGSQLDSSTGLFAWTPEVGHAGDYDVRVRVTDDGAPARSTDVSGTIVVVTQDSPVNQPPTLPAHPIYRTYPGFPIVFPIGATDPDGHDLIYRADDLPPGAALDENTGVLTWTPTSEQLGPEFVPYAVADNGVPPAEVESILVFQVAPLDPCVQPECDPALGCDPVLLPVGDICCDEEPTVRVAEPVADCPVGQVLHVGRNVRGFGRMQNCDRMRIESFGQGGHFLRLNIEARCIDSIGPVTLHVQLWTEDYLLVNSRYSFNDGQNPRPLIERNDGFVQALALIFAISPVAPVSMLDESAATLYVTLTDDNGLVLERRLRLVLTRSVLEDLSEPDVADVPAGEVGCVGCHRPLGPTGEREGIEDAHPWFALTCTDCHGGDPLAATRAEAHVDAGDGPTFLRNLAADQLDQVSLDYLQFVNPGDLRVAARGCGAQNPGNPGSGCHQRAVETVPLNVMATYSGHYKLPRYLAGSQGRELIFGAVDITNPNFDPATAPAGAVESMQALREPSPTADRSALSTCIDVYLPKSCPTCHLKDFGPNNAAGNYRSSGCTSCHMVYADHGRSESADPVISKEFPPHPLKHTLTTAIPTEQCSHCHFQGGRIGLAYRGIREGGFSPENTPVNGTTLGRELHAHAPDYYFSDEDDTNQIDETPPDLHHTAGLVCADCHIGGDVHGDGNLYSSERYQVGVRCEDCHGTVRTEIEEDIADGFFKNSRGFSFKRIRRSPDNRIFLKLLTEDRELEIPQIHRLLASGLNQAMNEAMGVDAHGFSHTDKMECYSCHTSWRQTCFGCHVTIDDQGFGLNATTGLESRGAVSVVRDNYSLDFFTLGKNERGKLSPLCSSMSVFMTYIDQNGVEQYRDRVRTSSDGKIGFGWNPFHHHTVSRVPQNCDRCHPVAPEVGPDNSTMLDATYGFGTGQFMTQDGDGKFYDLSAFLNAAGELMGDFPHPNTGPVPTDVRERAMSIEVIPHPRQ